MFFNRLNEKCQVRIIFISLLVTISTQTHAEDLLNLPDPLITNGGETVDSTTVWEQERRPEILELFRTHVYGRAPVGRPAEMTFEVLDTDAAALNGSATRKQIRVHLTVDSGRPYMDILIYLPNDQPRPVQLFMGLNFMGNHTIHADEDIVWTDNWTPWGTGARGSENSLWPVESILNRGYGVATIHCADLDEDRHDGFNDGVHGAFDPNHWQTDRPGDAWGTVGAWAWGLSRAMDYFEMDQDIDHAKVAILGHSRLGKTSLWAGAQDERFSIVISNDSGCTGAALARNMQGETIAAINGSFPHWFCENYKNYNNNEDALPVDQHMLIALMAPRPVYIASAELDAWADPEGEFLSGVHAAPVYNLYGLTGLKTTVMPPLDQPINDGHIGYHIRTGYHNVTAYDWECFMDYADKHWRQISCDYTCGDINGSGGNADMGDFAEMSRCWGVDPITDPNCICANLVEFDKHIIDLLDLSVLAELFLSTSLYYPPNDCSASITDPYPPTPDPMTFETAPYATDGTMIKMVATKAKDISGVEYYFNCTAGDGHNSGWQSDSSYQDTGLALNTEYTYTVKARDRSDAHNETAVSAGASATTLSYKNLVLPANGGVLEYRTSEYGGSWNVSNLTNGEINEDGWASAANPTSPQEFIYSFEGGNSANLDEAVIHGGTAEGMYYSRDVEVWISADGTSFTNRGGGMLANSSGSTVTVDLTGIVAKKIKLAVTSGYRTDYWELAEFVVNGLVIE